MGSDASPKKWTLKDQRDTYLKWFSLADDGLIRDSSHPSLSNSHGDGRLTGSDSLKFFAMSNLSRSELKQVWAIADSKRQGYLGFYEFMTAMQLVSLAQAGNDISQDTIENAACHSSESLISATWFNSKSGKKIPLRSVTSIIDGLKKLYIEKLRPLEKTYQFQDFVSPLLTSSDFDAKPMVMLLGQYSTGKTTFIKHLLKTSYPGAHIGPEPTTDRFVVITSGPDERCIPGNTIAVQADMPYSGLSSFGTAFLSKFECSQMPHPLLEHVTFVDTPGVLSGEKQRTQRSYDFTGVTSWFAAKCDLILLLFDPHKLDISDEFKRVIGSLRGHDDKIRIVLNKADQVDAQQLMRVYGALLWSLGKVLNTPEVMRVYIGYARPSSLINEFVKRARAAKVHAHIISHLKKEMPALMGKAKAQQKLLDSLDDQFAQVQKELHLPAGDFPSVEEYRQILSAYNFDKFEKLRPKMVQGVDDMLAYDIPELLKKFRNPYD
ncbi:hypothetical protein PR202_ga18651 [Eleusine coracana subsp. coracana]|uniref:EH domain-containing protein 1 n=1 Tax=Eleusine coracana subsp. coracana TaxID=191504 RepID=A0AAV5CTJ3_ELECO|nr:hypothetical protein PR202_ga18651 [Eleusine coracana subsp. coracana]